MSQNRIAIRTMLDGTLMVPLHDDAGHDNKTISDLKNYLNKLKGYDRGVQHIYQNGVELNDQANLSDYALGKGFVLMIPINHSTKRYKTQKEVEADYVASLTMNEINRQASTSGGSVSDQLEQIMAEFTSTHPTTSGTGSTTSPSATTRPPTLTTTTSSNPPRSSSASTTTQNPPRSTSTTTTAASTGTTSQQGPPITVDSLPVTEDLVAAITELGFSRHRAKKALILNDLNVEQAVEWIFSNIDSPYVLDSEFTPQELIELAEKYKNMMSDE